jgi:hypothetical protein
MVAPFSWANVSRMQVGAEAICRGLTWDSEWNGPLRKKRHSKN